jgi:hypothetical protein
MVSIMAGPAAVGAAAGHTARFYQFLAS